MFMKRTFSESRLAETLSKLEKPPAAVNPAPPRAPVHVVYGGAHLFRRDTPQKLSRLAMQSLDAFAPDFVTFAEAMWLRGADALPRFSDVIADLEIQLSADSEAVKARDDHAWFAWTIYRRVREKLISEAVEDFRIDFEDGYGLRRDAEEDAHAVSASEELAAAWRQNTNTPFCGFRVKSLAPETCRRAARTLDLFLTNLLDKTDGNLPENFVVTLPKITRVEEIEILADLLGDFEKQSSLPKGSIKIEIMIETPQSIVNEKGEIILRRLVEAGRNRVAAAHFGAYDYTASLGVAAEHQHLRHEACNFARQMMQISLAPLGVRLADSVTIEMPVALHKGVGLTEKQKTENRRAAHKAWRTHFNNVTHSLINGFYQSWDLHPAQLPARYAAVYSFFLESKESSARRLKAFIEKATQANLTGNTFDDAASAQGLLNFFLRALSCGAMNAEEIYDATGLTENELRSASFAGIMEARIGK
jgi:citrate lyase beta subunit